MENWAEKEFLELELELESGEYILFWIEKIWNPFKLKL